MSRNKNSDKSKQIALIKEKAMQLPLYPQRDKEGKIITRWVPIRMGVAKKTGFKIPDKLLDQKKVKVEQVQFVNPLDTLMTAYFNGGIGALEAAIDEYGKNYEMYKFTDDERAKFNTTPDRATPKT